jgi:hypothetical protein
MPMQLIADILLGAGALGAAFYCLVLSRRLKKFTRLENGMGGAIAVLSSQVDQMTKVLEAAQNAARNSADTLEAKTARGEKVAERLELILAAMHDLPAGGAKPKGGAKSAKATGAKSTKGAAAVAAAGGSDADTPAGTDAASSVAGPGGAGNAPAKAPADTQLSRARFVRRRAGRNDSEAA